MTQYFLGVDIGGTKSHALIADETGHALGFSAGGDHKPERDFPEGLMERIKETFGAIIGTVAAGGEMNIGQIGVSILSAEERLERDAFIRSVSEISEEF